MQTRTETAYTSRYATLRYIKMRERYKEQYVTKSDSKPGCLNNHGNREQASEYPNSTSGLILKTSSNSFVQYF